LPYFGDLHLPGPSFYIFWRLQVKSQLFGVNLNVACHRAEEWGLDKPLLNPHGELKIMQLGDECFIRLYDPQKNASGDTNLVLFAQAPIRVDDKFAKKGIDFYVQKVVDSSRYFAVRVEVSDHVTIHAWLSATFI
jgi:hypothetical protein